MLVRIQSLAASRGAGSSAQNDTPHSALMLPAIDAQLRALGQRDAERFVYADQAPNRRIICHHDITARRYRISKNQTDVRDAGFEPDIVTSLLLQFGHRPVMPIWARVAEMC